MRKFLLKESQYSILASHHLIWYLTSESKNDEKNKFSHGYLSQLIGPDTLPAYCSIMIENIISNFSPEAKILYENVFINIY